MKEMKRCDFDGKLVENETETCGTRGSTGFVSGVSSKTAKMRPWPALELFSRLSRDAIQFGIIARSMSSMQRTRCAVTRLASHSNT